jgi:ATP-dependent Lon protease
MFSSLDELINKPEPLETIPDELPILPLRGTVAFPFVIIPLNIGIQRSIVLIK